MLPEQPPVIVVDNGSGDDSAEAVARCFPAVEVVALARNAGAAASPLQDGGDVAVLGFLACTCVIRRAAFLGVGGFSELLFFIGEERLLAYDLAAAG